jgi:predicted transcriptional regulator
MARTDTQLKFRIPPDLKPRLEQAARANKRSINMEVIARLEQSFEAEGQHGGGEAESPYSFKNNVQGRLTEIEEALAALQRRVSIVAKAEIRARKGKR